MVAITYHGADCCGVRHISGFRDGEDANIQGLIRALNQVNMEGAAGFAAGDPRVPANGNLLLEVILSNRQTEQYPRLMTELARLGFVYDASWTGQHGTPVHRFSRARKRLRLADNGFRWAGMMMGPNVGGDLPVFREGNQQQQQDHQLTNRVRCTNQGSRHYNTTGTVVSNREYRHTSGMYDGIVVRLDDGGERTNVMAPSSWVRLEQENNNNDAPAVEYRHPRLHMALPPAPAAPEAPAPPREIILREFFALFRDGRVRGPFDTPAEVTEAYPRVRRYRCRIVYNNAEILNTDLNVGELER